MDITDNPLAMRVRNQFRLPAMPVSVQRLGHEFARPGVTVEAIGHIIETDPAMSARILRLANSAAYGFPRRIASVSHAIVLLGLNVIKGVALSGAVFEIAKSHNVDELWTHSLCVATAARLLATPHGRKVEEVVFTAGLLHDIGKVVLHASLPREMAQVGKVTRMQDLYAFQAEMQVLGFSHTDVATWVLDDWQIPDVVKEAIIHHHKPDQAPTAKIETALVHISDVLVKALGLGNSGDDLVPPVSHNAWNLLRLDLKTFAAQTATIAPQLEALKEVGASA